MGLRMVAFPDPDDILDFLPVAKMKESLRITYTKEDNFIADCILAAYSRMAGAYGWLNRSILPTTWEYTVESWPTSPNPLGIALPQSPYLSGLEVKQWDGSAMTAIDPSSYYVNPNGKYGLCWLSPVSSSWPGMIGAHPAGVSFQFVAGYGTDPEDIAAAHPDLVRGMLSLAGDLFRHREDTFVDIRMVEIDRKIINGMEKIAGRYKLYNKVI